MGEELKSCPFCGNVPNVAEFSNGWSVSCEWGRCLIQPGVQEMPHMKEAAIKQWNTRADPERHVLGVGCIDAHAMERDQYPMENHFTAIVYHGPMPRLVHEDRYELVLIKKEEADDGK